MKTLAAAVLLIGGCVVGLPGTAVAAGAKGDLVRASVSDDGVQGKKGAVNRPALSSDGVRVAFTSSAANLVSGDTNGENDVFVKNLTTGHIVRVTTTSKGKQLEGPPVGDFQPTLSADGRKVAFHSGSALLPGDNPGILDVYVREVRTMKLVRASATADGKGANSYSSEPSLSQHGGKVSFTSSASNLTAADKNYRRDIFVKNLASGAVVLASSSAAGVPGNQDSYDSSLSADGKRVAFVSEAKNLVPGDDGSSTDVFVKDLATGAIVWSTVEASAQRAVGSDPSLSVDGKRVAFSSDATDLVPGDTNGTTDVFVKDLVSGALTRISTNAAGVQAVEGSFAPAISGDGRRVAFASSAPDLTSDDENYEEDIFVKTLSTGAITLVSTTTGGGQGDDGSSLPAVSQGGRKIAFLSEATNLVRADTNNAGDVFVKSVS